MERRNLVYGLILALLLTALAVVGVLILRKRSTGLPGIVRPSTSGARQMPTDTKPIESFPRAEPWEEGDPIPTSGFDEVFPPTPEDGS